MKYSVYRPTGSTTRIPTALSMKDYDFVGEIYADVPSSVVFLSIKSHLLNQNEIVKGLLVVDSNKKAFVLTESGKWAEVLVYK